MLLVEGDGARGVSESLLDPAFEKERAGPVGILRDRFRQRALGGFEARAAGFCCCEPEPRLAVPVVDPNDPAPRACRDVLAIEPLGHAGQRRQVFGLLGIRGHRRLQGRERLRGAPEVEERSALEPQRSGASGIDRERLLRELERLLSVAEPRRHLAQALSCAYGARVHVKRAIVFAQGSCRLVLFLEQPPLCIAPQRFLAGILVAWSLRHGLRRARPLRRARGRDPQAQR